MDARELFMRSKVHTNLGKWSFEVKLLHHIQTWGPIGTIWPQQLWDKGQMFTCIIYKPWRQATPVVHGDCNVFPPGGGWSSVTRGYHLWRRNYVNRVIFDDQTRNVRITRKGSKNNKIKKRGPFCKPNLTCLGSTGSISKKKNWYLIIFTLVWFRYFIG